MDEKRKEIESEVRIKELKDALILKIQLRVEYKFETILPEDWDKIYYLLDEQLLDEIFQERDALDV